MEIKDKKIIDTLAKTLGVPKENLSGVKILSPEDYAAEMKKMVEEGSALLVNTYFKENFLKRIDDEMNKAAKLKDANHLLLMLSHLRQKCLAIKEDSPELGRLFEFAEQLGAVGYSIFVASKVNDGDWFDFTNSKTK